MNNEPRFFFRFEFLKFKIPSERKKKKKGLRSIKLRSPHPHRATLPEQGGKAEGERGEGLEEGKVLQKGFTGIEELH